MRPCLPYDPTSHDCTGSCQPGNNLFSIDVQAHLSCRVPISLFFTVHISLSIILHTFPKNL